MSRHRIIGDIHGHWYDYSLLTENIKHKSIQVGDFGRGFRGSYWEERAEEYHKSKQHRFIRGNHDNPEICKSSTGWIQDGTVENYGDKTVMYIGGAWSIDSGYRTEGIDWWKDEELSIIELNTLYDIYCVTRPDIMITHDCPTLTAYSMFIKEGRSISYKTLHLTRTGEALQAMFEAHQPSYWFFGHWHYTKQYEMLGTKFHCLGINDFVDFDFATLEYTNAN